MKNNGKGNYEEKNILERIIEIERKDNMYIDTLNAVSGAIMSPMVDKLCKKVSAEEV